jgi:sRNA-binding protein
MTATSPDRPEPDAAAPAAAAAKAPAPAGAGSAGAPAGEAQAAPIGEPQAVLADAPVHTGDAASERLDVPPDSPADAPAGAAAAATSPAAPADMTPVACGERLAELFPALFTVEGPRKPLKLRIQADIQQRAPGVFSKRLLSFFFSRYTTTTAYLKALAHAPHRFDLDGNPAGDIADDHRQAAATELARRQAIVDARRAAQRQAQRTAAAASAPDGTGSAPDRPARRDSRHGPPHPSPRNGPRRDAHDRPHGATGPRPPRPAAGSPEGHTDRSPRPERHGAGAARARADGPGRPDRLTSHRPPHAAAPERRPPPSRPTADAASNAPALPVDPQRRERALLLRAWESSPLAKPNFCALKGLTVAEFDAQIALAQRERAERSTGGGGT